MEKELQIAAAMAEAIRSLGSVPSGHLYARLMGHVNLETYQLIISVLVKANLVKQENFLLTWIGPNKES